MVNDSPPLDALVGPLAGGDRLGQPHARVALALQPGRTEDVEGPAGGRGDEPGLGHADLRPVGGCPPLGHVADDVLGLDHAAEHPVGDRHELGPGRVEGGRPAVDDVTSWRSATRSASMSGGHGGRAHGGSIMAVIAAAAARPDRIEASASVPAGPIQSPATARPATPATSTPGRSSVSTGRRPGVVAGDHRAWDVAGVDDVVPPARLGDVEGRSIASRWSPSSSSGRR